MAQRTRVLAIKKHEVAFIRVDAQAWKVVLEFEHSQLTVFEQGGKLFTRQELIPDISDVETMDETESEDDDEFIETQPMTPLLKRRSAAEILQNVTIRKRMSMAQKTDLEELQLELFGDFDAGDTQLDVSP